MCEFNTCLIKRHSDCPLLVLNSAMEFCNWLIWKQVTSPTITSSYIIKHLWLCRFLTLRFYANMFKVITRLYNFFEHWLTLVFLWTLHYPLALPLLLELWLWMWLELKSQTDVSWYHHGPPPQKSPMWHEHDSVSLPILVWPDDVTDSDPSCV